MSESADAHPTVLPRTIIARALVNGTSSHLPQAKRENGEEATLGDLQESQRVLLQLIDIWDGLVLSVLPDSLITSA